VFVIYYCAAWSDKRLTSDRGIVSGYAHFEGNELGSISIKSEHQGQGIVIVIYFDVCSYFIRFYASPFYQIGTIQMMQLTMLWINNRIQICCRLDKHPVAMNCAKVLWRLMCIN